MSKPWEHDSNFLMYLNSGNWGTHPLEPRVTKISSAFRQELEIPLTLSKTGKWLCSVCTTCTCLVMPCWIHPMIIFVKWIILMSMCLQIYCGDLCNCLVTNSPPTLQDLVQQLGFYVFPLHWEEPTITGNDTRSLQARFIKSSPPNSN